MRPRTIKPFFYLLFSVLLLTLLPLTASAEADAPMAAYVILGGKDFAQLRMDSEHPYLYDTEDGHHELEQTLREKGDWTAWFDAANGVLHLKNFHTTDYALVENTYSLVFSDGRTSLIVDMHGANTMRYPQTFKPDKNLFGFYGFAGSGSGYGDLTFRSSDGDGSLTVEQISEDPDYVNSRPIVIQWANRNGTSATSKGNHVIMESGELYLIQKGVESKTASDYYVIHAGISIDIKGGRIYSEMENRINRSYSGVNDSVPNRGVFTGGHYTAKKNSYVGWLSAINEWKHPQSVWTAEEALEGQYDLYNPMPMGDYSNYLDVVTYTKVIITLPDGSTLEKNSYYDQDLPALTPEELPALPGYLFDGCTDADGTLWYDAEGVGKHLKSTALTLELTPVWIRIPEAGDRSILPLWICLLAASLAAGILISRKRKSALHE